MQKTRSPDVKKAELRIAAAEGCGNRFIIVDRLKELARGSLTGKARASLGKTLCEKFPATDSILLISAPKSETASAMMRILEKDGSESDMCGNGIRCVAKYLRDAHAFPESMLIETKAGIRKVGHTKGNTYAVEMGKVAVNIRPIFETQINGTSRNVYFANSGEPHAVIFLTDVSKLNIDKIGRQVRRNPIFGAGGSNVNFVQIINEDTIRVRTYERGVEGETEACGTGATASAAMAVKRGIVHSKIINVICNGGVLKITYDGVNAILEGPANVFQTKDILLNL